MRLPFSRFSRRSSGYSRSLFSSLPLPLALQIYEESKMNLEQERPFVCSAPGCSQVSVGPAAVSSRVAITFREGSGSPWPPCLLWALLLH